MGFNALDRPVVVAEHSVDLSGRTAKIPSGFFLLLEVSRGLSWEDVGEVGIEAVDLWSVLLPDGSHELWELPAHAATDLLRKPEVRRAEWTYALKLVSEV